MRLFKITRLRGYRLATDKYVINTLQIDQIDTFGDLAHIKTFKLIDPFTYSTHSKFRVITYVPVTTNAYEVEDLLGIFKLNLSAINWSMLKEIDTRTVNSNEIL